MLPTHRKTTHPGEMLAKEFLKPYGLSQYRLAQILDVPEMRISRLVRGINPMTPDMAQRLEALFGVSAEFWMNLQIAHDLSGHRLPKKTVTKIARHHGELVAA